MTVVIERGPFVIVEIIDDMDHNPFESVPCTYGLEDDSDN